MSDARHDESQPKHEPTGRQCCPNLNLPTEACVIRAKVTSWPGRRILFGHPNPGEEGGMTFCRSVDGLGYKADEIVPFEVLWEDDPEPVTVSREAFDRLAGEVEKMRGYYPAFDTVNAAARALVDEVRHAE